MVVIQGWEGEEVAVVLRVGGLPVRLGLLVVGHYQ